MKDKSHFSIIGSGGGLDETPRDEITFDWTNMRVKNKKVIALSHSG